jgi:hypothetical protein
MPPYVSIRIVPERGRAGRVNHGSRSEKDERNANGNDRKRESGV